MKTLVSYIRESFNDSILKEYFAYANKLDGETKRLLTAPIYKSSTGIDLHNVEGKKFKFNEYDNIGSIKSYFDTFLENSVKYSSSGPRHFFERITKVFILKMQKDNITIFGLITPIDKYYDKSPTYKDLQGILPDNMNDPKKYVVYDSKNIFSTLSKAIKRGWNVSVFKYSGDGQNDTSELYKLRLERKLNKQGVLDNSEEFLSWYKDNQVRKRLLKLIQNASKRADPDYKAMLDEAKEEINKLFKFIDTLNRATKAAGHDIDVKGSEDTSYILQQIDNYVMKATEMLNNPDFYTSVSTVIKDHFIGYIDSIKSLIDDAYQSMKGTIEFDFRKNKV